MQMLHIQRRKTIVRLIYFVTATTTTPHRSGQVISTSISFGLANNGWSLNMSRLVAKAPSAAFAVLACQLGEGCKLFGEYSVAYRPTDGIDHAPFAHIGLRVSTRAATTGAKACATAHTGHSRACAQACRASAGGSRSVGAIRCRS